MTAADGRLAPLAVLVPLGLIFCPHPQDGGQLPQPGLLHPDSRSRPARAGGGMANGLVGSAVMIGLASLLGLPIGILGAIYLTEFGGNRLRHGNPLLRRRPVRHPLHHHRHGGLHPAGGADEGVLRPGRGGGPGPDHDPHRAAHHRGAAEDGARHRCARRPWPWACPFGAPASR